MHLATPGMDGARGLAWGKGSADCSRLLQIWVASVVCTLADSPTAMPLQPHAPPPTNPLLQVLLLDPWNSSRVCVPECALELHHGGVTHIWGMEPLENTTKLVENTHTPQKYINFVPYQLADSNIIVFLHFVVYLLPLMNLPIINTNAVCGSNLATRTPSRVGSALSRCGGYIPATGHTLRNSDGSSD